MSQARFDASYGSDPAENYERFFVPAIGKPFAEVLVRRAAIQPDDRVLDVACGTGIVARLLSEARNGRGGLVGLDPNASMLVVAERVTSPSAGIEWYQAGADEIPFPAESFDVVVCQMGLQFMEDQAAALREMCRVLAAEGRLLLSVPGPIAGIFALLALALERNFTPQAAGFVRKVFSLHDVDELEQLVEAAGFVGVTVEAEEHVLVLPPPGDFLWQYIHSTPLAAVVSQAGAEAAAALEREVLDSSAGLVRDDVLEHRQRLVVASGTKAS